MFKHQLQWTIHSDFGIPWCEITSPWELTFDQLVDWVEQAIAQESKNDPDESKLQEQIFEEIKRGVIETIPENGENITLERRFEDLVPWYCRANTRNAIIRSLNRRYAWHFQRDPAPWVIIVAFFIAGLVGAILLDSFKSGSLVLTVCWAALAVYIFSGLLLDRLIAQHLVRFPFDTIGEAVREILDDEMKEVHAHVKYCGNRNAIQEQLENILTGIYVKSQKLFLQTKLGMDFATRTEKGDNITS